MTTKTRVSWALWRIIFPASWIAIFISCLLSGQAQNILNVDFGGGTPVSLKRGFAATGLTTNDFWNFYTRDDGSGGYRPSGVLNDLKWAGGLPSGINLAVTNAAGAWGNGSSDPMFEVYLYPLSGPADKLQVSLSKVPPGDYELYIYGHGVLDTENGIYAVTTPPLDYGVQSTTTNPGWNTTNWAEGLQYVRFTNVTVSAAGEIDIEVRKGTTLAVINGLQLVKKSLPEPETERVMNIDFGGGTPASLKRGFAAIGQTTNDFWNFYSRDNGSGGYRSFGVVQDLKWADETATTASIGVSNAAGAWGNGSPDRMFEVYLYPLGSVAKGISIGMTNLPAGTYDLYIYGHGVLDGENGVYEVTVPPLNYGTKATTKSPGWNTTNWVEGQQYVLFKNIVVEDGYPLNIQVDNGGILPVINGLQLVKKVPSQTGFLANVDFSSGVAVSPKKGPAAFGFSPMDFWNLYSRESSNGQWRQSGTITNLALSDGTITPMSLSVTNARGAWGNEAMDPMFEIYLYPLTSSPDINLRLSHMPPGDYSFYLYGHGLLNSENAVFELFTGGVSLGQKATATGTNWNTTNWVEGQQYVLFNGVEPSINGDVDIVVRPGSSGLSMINGLQIVRHNASGVVIYPMTELFTNQVTVYLIGNTAGNDLRYTLDGSEPSTNSLVYAAPIVLTSTATVKAQQYNGILPVGEPASATYSRVYALADGVPNTWREQYFGPGYLTDPRVPASADPDSDGFTNLQEYVGGTNPLDADSIPIYSQIRAVPVVTWNSQANKVYKISRRDSLQSTNWVQVGDLFTATTTNSMIIDLEAGPVSFYRIESVPQP